MGGELVRDALRCGLVVVGADHEGHPYVRDVRPGEAEGLAARSLLALLKNAAQLPAICVLRAMR